MTFFITLHCHYIFLSLSFNELFLSCVTKCLCGCFSCHCNDHWYLNHSVLWLCFHYMNWRCCVNWGAWSCLCFPCCVNNDCEITIKCLYILKCVKSDIPSILLTAMELNLHKQRAKISFMYCAFIVITCCDWILCFINLPVVAADD